MIVDEPQGAYYGGIVAAPVAQEIFENIFEFAGYSNEEQEEKQKIILDSFIGQSLTQAVSSLAGKNMQYLVQGEGDYVTGQIPAPGSKVQEGDVILLMFN